MTFIQNCGISPFKYNVGMNGAANKNSTTQ